MRNGDESGVAGERRAGPGHLFDVVARDGTLERTMGADRVGEALRAAGPGSIACRAGEGVPDWALTAATTLGRRYATASACYLLPDVETSRAKAGRWASGIHEVAFPGTRTSPRTCPIEPALARAAARDEEVLAALAEGEVRTADDWPAARGDLSERVRRILDDADLPPRPRLARPRRSCGPFPGQGTLLDAADAWQASLEGRDAEVALAIAIGESRRGEDMITLAPNLGVTRTTVGTWLKRITPGARSAWVDAALAALAPLGPAFPFEAAGRMPGLEGVDRRPGMLAFVLTIEGRSLVETASGVVAMPMSQRSWSMLERECRRIVGAMIGATISEVRAAVASALPRELRKGLGGILWAEVSGFVTGARGTKDVGVDHRVEMLGEGIRTRIARAMAAKGGPMTRPEVGEWLLRDGGPRRSLASIDNALTRSFHTYADGRVGLAAGLPWPPDVVRVMTDAVHAEMGRDVTVPMDSATVASVMWEASRARPDPRRDTRLALSLLATDARFATRSGAVAMRAGVPWPTKAEMLESILGDSGPMTNGELVEAHRVRFGVRLVQPRETSRTFDGVTVPVAVRIGKARWGLWGHDVAVGMAGLPADDATIATLTEETRESLFAILVRVGGIDSRERRFRGLADLIDGEEAVGRVGPEGENSAPPPPTPRDPPPASVGDRRRGRPRGPGDSYPRTRASATPPR